MPRHSIAARVAASNTKSGEVPAAFANFDNLPDSAQVSIKTVSRIFDAAESTIWYRVKRRDLPAPRKFGSSTRWNVGELRAVLASATAQVAA